jgi:hypothetical protein
MTDDDNVIDAEIVENLPAAIEHPEPTHEPVPPIEATRSQAADGRDWPHGPKPERRCTAHSSRTGDPCKNAAIKGHNVCRYHGGAAKQVKQAARTRLENAADLMAKQLLGIALTADNEGVKLAAIRDALDRAGLKPPSEVVLSQGESKPYEQVFDGIYSGPREGSPSVASTYGLVGADTPSPAMVDLGYAPADTDSASWSEGPESFGDDPPREPRPRDRDRDRQPQPRELHITGDDAMRLANAVNRETGAMKAIESPHKGYRRP